MPDKDESKPKKIEDELREEQEKVVKNLLSEMGLTSKEVETILEPAGGADGGPGGPEPAGGNTAEEVSEVPVGSPEPQSEEVSTIPTKTGAPEGGPEGEGMGAMPGIESIFSKFDDMTRTVSALERGIAASLSTKLLEFRRDLIDLRVEIANKLTERLRMKAFAPMVERAISEVVVDEVKRLEESLLESFSKEIISKFKNFREDISGSKQRILDAIQEQADIYGAHGRSLEDEVTLKERQIKDLKGELAKRETIISEQVSMITEYEKRTGKLEAELNEAAGSPQAGIILVNDLKAKVEAQQSTIDRLKSQVIESSELKARVKAYEDSNEEKRKKIEELNDKVMELEGKYAEAAEKARDLVPQNVSLRAENDKLRAENLATVKDRSRAIELDASLQRAKQEIQDLKGIIEETEDRVEQRKAEVARIVKVMSKEPKYKVLTILKDCTLNYTEIARAIGQPVAIAKRYSQELQQDGYVKIEDVNVTGVGEWAKRVGSESKETKRSA